MEPAPIPETIRTIIDQAGGLGLRGAFTYIGASQLRYRCARADGEYRSAYPSRLTSEAGPPRVDFGVIRLRELPVPMACCDTPDRIYDYWMANIATAVWYSQEVESLCVIHLNTRRRATGFHLAGIGTLDTVLMSPREILRTAILRNASAIVVAHSHPSGDPKPSEADLRATRELIQAGRIIRIEVLDHVVVRRSAPDHPRPWASLWELGTFY